MIIHACNQFGHKKNNDVEKVTAKRLAALFENRNNIKLYLWFPINPKLFMPPLWIWIGKKQAFAC